MNKEDIIQFFKNHDFTVRDISKEPQELFLEIETCSPAGEDLFETIHCKDDCEEVEVCLYDLWRHFDVEDHVTMWLDAKRNGMAGVPDVITLVHDAEDIEGIYEQLYEDFNNLLKDEKEGLKIYLFQEADRDGNGLGFQQFVFVVARNKDVAFDMMCEEFENFICPEEEISEEKAKDLGFYKDKLEAGIYY